VFYVEQAVDLLPIKPNDCCVIDPKLRHTGLSGFALHVSQSLCVFRYINVLIVVTVGGKVIFYLSAPRTGRCSENYNALFQVQSTSEHNNNVPFEKSKKILSTA